jgi:superfamily II DNA or RNA helicase
MSFEKLKIRSSYESDESNSILNELYNPVLKNAKSYKRSVGYFNSKLLLHLVEGLEGLINNSGTFQLIVSPQLDQEDIEAINDGYALKDLVSDKLVNELNKLYYTLEDIDNLILLKQLIKNGFLEIKVALLKNKGIYHEKIGIFADMEDKKIAFNGSLNETYAALFNNYESIDVFRSWIPSEYQRIIEKEVKFDELWNNNNKYVDVLEFPTAVIDKIIKKNKKNIPLQKEVFSDYQIKDEGPKLLDKSLKYRDYQLKAILEWKKNNYRGIFSMATGTGKTLTAIGALVHLWNNISEPLFTIIICPYTHLVEQWIEDLERFNIKSIIAYGQYKWENDLKNEVRSISHGLKNYSCVITTNSTYSTDRFQKTINKIKVKQVIIVDEVHNFGAKKIRDMFIDKIEYRLALSATPKRYFDEEGTNDIIEYFDKIVFELSLRDAIEKDFLTKYYYFPVLVYLNDDEYEEYKEITLKIAKCYVSSSNEDSVSDSLTSLLIKRARILNLAESKIDCFKKLIDSRTGSYNNLVYCAAGKQKNDKRQIDVITDILGNELNMDIRRFTSQEKKDARSRIIEDFSNNSTQCIVAIKCLDEGVNIPSIETAYILASSGNEKEFIQRRGRVLRKYPGKKFAKIYDFVVLPRVIKDVPFIEDKLKNIDKRIINKELARMKEFTDLSINKSDGERVIYDIEEAYEIIC